MDFSDIYQRLKFEEYEISEDERIQLTDYLRSRGSISRPESHAVFCYSSESTPENVKLVRKFLAEDTDDYARSAAVDGLYRIWRLGTASDVNDLLGFLALWSVESRHDTSMAAIGCAFHLMHQRNDHRLSIGLMGLLETLHEEVRRENELRSIYSSMRVGPHRTIGPRATDSAALISIRSKRLCRFFGIAPNTSWNQ
ncbi:hypothetical protein [Mesorhizobium sp. M1322]|uniref:hypothetical protein n=1 Tax=Mesorhizobium sp. M1322 TaxID=2957081 RepID=UPI003336B5D8